MKRKNVFFIAIMLFVFTAKAQISLGVKAGANFLTDVKIEKINTDDPIKNIKGESNGFHVGIWTRISIPLILAVRPEIIYTQITNKNSISNLTTQKMDIPLLIEKSFLGFLNVHLGPTFQYVIGNDFDTKKMEKIKTEDFSTGFVVGVGVKIKKIGIDVRYETGLQESNIILEEVAKNNKYKLDNRNKQIILSVYYDFF